MVATEAWKGREGRYGRRMEREGVRVEYTWRRGWGGWNKAGRGNGGETEESIVGVEEGVGGEDARTLGCLPLLHLSCRSAGRRNRGMECSSRCLRRRSEKKAIE